MVLPLDIMQTNCVAHFLVIFVKYDLIEVKLIRPFLLQPKLTYMHFISVKNKTHQVTVENISHKNAKAHIFRLRNTAVYINKSKCILILLQN